MEDDNDRHSNNNNNDDSDDDDGDDTLPIPSSGLPLRVVFLHLDWGIGGAEQLMLQLATASVQLGHSVQLVTTRCEPTHCFSQLKPGTGTLWPYLKVYGQWIPQDLFGGQWRAVCSTLRVLYLAWKLSLRPSTQEPPPDVIVTDVLPTPLPLLQHWIPTAALLFYCHFPDQLLVQQQSQRSRGLYRRTLDAIENATLPYADTIVVNSQFTQRTVLDTFACLRSYSEAQLPVLYPALDTTALDHQVNANAENDEAFTPPFAQPPIVSLNRYERKKNLLLLLQAVQWLREQYPKLTLPKVIIAGGYDVHNVENVQHRGELQHYVDQHAGLGQIVEFRHSISDAERAYLLRQALCVVYTPTNEHFGIVPLEAMYCGTPVVAVNTGGPVETVVHGTTGFLCDPTPEAFGRALHELLQHSTRAQSMGVAAREHVQQTFGHDRMRRQWRTLMEQTVQRATARRHQYSTTYAVLSALTWLLDAVLTLAVVLLVTRLLQYAGILHSTDSIWGALRQWMSGLLLRLGGGGGDKEF